MSPPPAASADLSAGAEGSVRLDATVRRRLVAERVARWVVVAGGVAVIASILGILAFLLVEVIPLVASTRVEEARRLGVSGGAPRALLVDEHRTHVVSLGADARLRVQPLAGGDASETALADGDTGVELVAVRAVPADGRFVAATSDGRLALVPVDFAVSFEGQTRVVTPVVGEATWLRLDPAGAPLLAFAARDDGSSATAVGQLADGRLRITRRSVEENLFTGETTVTEEQGELAIPLPAKQLLLDGPQSNLFGVTEDGRLLWWALRGVRAQDPVLLSHGTTATTAMGLLIGDRSLVAGRADGSLVVWSQVLEEDGPIVPRAVRTFPPQGAAIASITGSGRNRSFLAQDEGGGLGLYFSTSHRILWRGASPLSRIAAVTYAPKGDALFLADDAELVELAVANEHPESAWSTFFGRIWYEGYTGLDYVWQSTGGTDDFESKISLTPLLFGTLKATVYSLALAIPLAVLAAIYTAQFMHPRYQKVVKPTIEVMASLPSVVLGFLAGLWLAPRLERAFPGLLLAAVAVPLLAVLAGALWNALPRRWRGGLRDGTEVAWHALVLAVGLGVCFALSGSVEAWLFDGDFPAWLRARTGLAYEQRNAIVVGIAMGFAVIPIIFAISEDALSNVPRDMVAGSLALGADRWQTVVRVVLPTASPGIFSAIMVGFGRAIGETMIVLMATGNTPIMDWSAFNGFRTLSANIAVEIPEAPVGSTLYRTLFVAAILLFMVTFVVNTLAEVVRHRLRSKYARL